MSGALSAPSSVAGALLALTLTLNACSSPVRSDLSEPQADALVLALDEAAIAATKERGRVHERYEVRVPHADLASALRVLESQGRLAPEPPGMAEVLGEPAMVPTPGEERERRAFALAGELTRSIELLPGVAHARVHLSPPGPRTALDAAVGAWHASVVVQRAAGRPRVDESAVRALIRGAVDPLPIENVAIVQIEREAPRALAWTRLGPFTVARRDAAALKATLATALGLSALSALLSIAVVARRRAREGHAQAHAQGRAQPPSAGS